MEVPNRPISFVPVSKGEILPIGPMTLRIIEDGSGTDNRLGVVELIIPPHTSGPTSHWHEMHDEGFLVTKGTVRFHAPVPTSESTTPTHVDAPSGAWITVPIRAPHTFSNPFDEEARFINTFTPAFYVNYFKVLSKLQKAGEAMTKEANEGAMKLFATIQVPDGAALPGERLVPGQS